MATDLDGTLLRSDGSISARTLEALRLAEGAGATVVFISGRPPRWLDVLAEAVGPHGTAICANGALLYDVRRRRVLEQHGLESAAALKVALVLREAVPGVVFAMERELTYGKEPAFLHRWVLPEGALEAEVEMLLAEPVAKLLARHPDLAPDEFIAAGLEVIGDLATTTYSDTTALLEISAPGVSKASALARFCAELGVGADEVIAFGDMPNDELMLEWAGTSYAMANAHPRAVAAAGWRCPGNDDDGVAQVLERLYG